MAPWIQAFRQYGYGCMGIWVWVWAYPQQHNAQNTTHNTQHLCQRGDGVTHPDCPAKLSQRPESWARIARSGPR
eukprot:scaffold10283_cov31-Tisochrysis_lutea.AAC.6